MSNDTSIPAPTDDSAPDSSAPATPDAPKPSLFLTDEQIDDAGLGDCQVGDSYTATVTLRATGVNESDSGRSKTFDVDSITDVKPAGSPDEGDNSDNSGDSGDEPQSEEDILGYKRPSAKPGFPVDMGKLRSE